MINYQQAKNILKKAKIKIQDEEISIKNSLNRVVAKDIISPSNHPLGDNAAFDGFAINSKDTKNLNKKNSKQFRILGSIAAGNKPFNKNVKKLVLPSRFSWYIKSPRLIYSKRLRNRMQSIIAESGDVAETTGEKIATIIRHQQNVSVNFIETISESTLLKREKRGSRQSLLDEFANEVETA